MEIVEFLLKFEHLGERLTASCQKFKVIKVPQVRVALTFQENETVITFYEIKENNKTSFFWFRFNNKNIDTLGHTIEIALLKSRKAKAKVP